MDDNKKILQVKPNLVLCMEERQEDIEKRKMGKTKVKEDRKGNQLSRTGKHAYNKQSKKIHRGRMEDNGSKSAGCAAVGDTEEETWRNFQDALAAHFQAMRELGEPIPEPSSSVDYVEVAA